MGKLAEAKARLNAVKKAKEQGEYDENPDQYMSDLDVVVDDFLGDDAFESMEAEALDAEFANDAELSALDDQLVELSSERDALLDDPEVAAALDSMSVDDAEWGPLVEARKAKKEQDENNVNASAAAGEVAQDLAGDATKESKKTTEGGGLENFGGKQAKPFDDDDKKGKDKDDKEKDKKKSEAKDDDDKPKGDDDDKPKDDKSKDDKPKDDDDKPKDDKSKDDKPKDDKSKEEGKEGDEKSKDDKSKDDDDDD